MDSAYSPVVLSHSVVFRTILVDGLNIAYREAGIRLASLWITRAEFVREYEKIEDFWFPVKDEIFVDVKLYGRKTLTIEYPIDGVNDAKVVATELRGVPAVEFAAVTVARPHIRPATGAPSF